MLLPSATLAEIAVDITADSVNLPPQSLASSLKSSAQPSEVVMDKKYGKFTNGHWEPQIGTMPNHGVVTYTPTTLEQPIPAGYHNGSGIVKGDPNLIPENIRKGVTIFGIVGTFSGTPATEPKGIFRDVLQDGSLSPEMVWIPAGAFRMGDIQGDGSTNEQPVHEVFVKRFAMGRYEVTFAEYDKFAEATGREKPNDMGWGRDNRPVMQISWHDATAYAEWLSQQTGHKYRLPTEAEWEYATRARTETKFWWGNEKVLNQANCNGCGGQWDNTQTAQVGSFASNPFDLYDMAGNVCEWTCSAYENQYQGMEQHCAGKEDMSLRVIRGGAWNTKPTRARTTSRNGASFEYRKNNVGFRLARD